VTPGTHDDAGRIHPGSVNPFTAPPRLHVAARIEDVLDRAVAAWLRRRGWTVRIESYPGYGSPGWIRLLGRALLAAPVTADDELPGAGASEAGEAPGSRPAVGTPGSDAGRRSAPSARTQAVRGWRSFLTAPVAHAWVEAEVGGTRHELRTDRAGYLDHILAVDLPPGRHEVVLRSRDGRSATCPVLVVDPDATVGLVSDVDDTVMVTRLPRPAIAAWNVFVRDEHAREAVPGMAELYGELTAAHPRMPTMYLSTGAWNAAPAVARFLHRMGFPAGALLMTDWGPTNTGWFRSGRRHKVTQLRRLFHEFPHVRWVLVGDDGQHDPQIYAGAVRHHPRAVRAVLLRQLTSAEHVLAHGLPVPIPEGAEAEHAVASEPVVVLQGPDGFALLDQARAAGLVPGGTT
jgi:phosphatidate phosphatase APP1